MGVQLMEVGRQVGIEKFVAIGTICAYPKFTPVPFKEEHLWDGYTGRNERTLWLGQELDVACPIAGLSPAIRIQLHRALSRESLWSQGQLRSGNFARHPRPDP